MKHLSRSFINHVNLCSIGAVSEGEVENEVLFSGSVEESENVRRIHPGRCTVPDPVRDINAANLINVR